MSARVIKLPAMKFLCRIREIECDFRWRRFPLAVFMKCLLGGVFGGFGHA